MVKTWDKSSVKLYLEYLEEEKAADPRIKRTQGRITELEKQTWLKMAVRLLIRYLVYILEKLIEQAAKRAIDRVEKKLHQNNQ
jgi:hypothetical protein